MKSCKVFIIILFVCAVVPNRAKTAELSSDKFDISGFFRIRAWGLFSDSAVPGSFAGGGSYDNEQYSDVFLRNRFSVEPVPELSIVTVFDISGVLARGDFSMGNAGVNLITRNLYCVLEPSASLKIHLGLQPFTLFSGHVLSRDAAGIKAEQSFLNNEFSFSLGFIKAFNDALSDLVPETAEADYREDNIYYVLIKTSPVIYFRSEAGYVYEHDNYLEKDGDSAIDSRRSELHWFGAENNFFSGSFFFRLGLIYNFGSVEPDCFSENKTVKEINSGLLELSGGYNFSLLKISAGFEGATGNPADPDSSSSFQDIKGSRGFSLIAVDNSGGLSVRGSGESSWYGLCGATLKFETDIMNLINVKLNLFHFRSRNGSDWFGDEADLLFSAKIYSVVECYINCGLFFPGEGYRYLYDLSSEYKKPIIELMAGARADY